METNQFTLQRKTFVVTGGTRGLGLEISRSLLSQGATVLICSRNSSDVAHCVEMLSDECDLQSSNKKTSANNDDERVLGCCCDVSTSEGRQALCVNVEEAFGGGLDGLINNVGFNSPMKIGQQTELEYREIFMSNTEAAYFLCKSLEGSLTKPSLRGSQQSCVVNVASVGGQLSTGSGIAYEMSKAALIQFTKSLAVEWAPKNIRVNAVAPWMMYNEKLEEAVRVVPSALDTFKRRTPMGRLADPAEVAGPVAFLCMPAASFVTGVCLNIDGGASCQMFEGPTSC